MGVAIQFRSLAEYDDSASSCLAAVWHRHSWRLGLILSHTRRAVADVRWRKIRRRAARAAAVWSRWVLVEMEAVPEAEVGR